MSLKDRRDDYLINGGDGAYYNEVLDLKDKLHGLAQAGWIASQDGKRMLPLKIPNHGPYETAFSVIEVNEEGNTVSYDRIGFDKSEHVENQTHVIVDRQCLDKTSPEYGAWEVISFNEDIFDMICEWEARADYTYDMAVQQAANLSVYSVIGNPSLCTVHNDMTGEFERLELKGLERSRYAALSGLAKMAEPGNRAWEVMTGGMSEDRGVVAMALWKDAQPYYGRRIEMESKAVRSERVVAKQVETKKERTGFDTSKWDVQTDNDMQFGN